MLKQVTFISANIANDIKPKNNEAMISINEPESKYQLKYEKDWKDRLIRLYFHDIDQKHLDQNKNIIKDYLEQTNAELVLFNEDQAREIILFLDRISKLDRINIVYVHCGAGISRSASVAKFIAQKYGLPFNHSYSLYNRLVFSILLNEDYYARVWRRK